MEADEGNDRAKETERKVHPLEYRWRMLIQVKNEHAFNPSLPFNAAIMKSTHRMLDSPIRTVEEFWQYWHWVVLELLDHSMVTGFGLFREGWQPLWEDAAWHANAPHRGDEQAGPALLLGMRARVSKHPDTGLLRLDYDEVNDIFMLVLLEIIGLTFPFAELVYGVRWYGKWELCKLELWIRTRRVEVIRAMSERIHQLFQTSGPWFAWEDCGQPIVGSDLSITQSWCDLTVSDNHYHPASSSAHNHRQRPAAVHHPPPNYSGSSASSCFSSPAEHHHHGLRHHHHQPTCIRNPTASISRGFRPSSDHSSSLSLSSIRHLPAVRPSTGEKMPDRRTRDRDEISGPRNAALSSVEAGVISRGKK